jgi:hypothetical protein
MYFQILAYQYGTSNHITFTCIKPQKSGTDLNQASKPETPVPGLYVAG